MFPVGISKKKNLFPVGEGSNLVLLVGILRCKVSSFPIKYLGLSLGAKIKMFPVGNTIVNKFEFGLGGWKMNYLRRED